MNNNKVLFVAVHPDDETLGCGGTILKHKHNGDDIYWLILTAPTLSHPYNFSPKDIEERKSLVEEVSEQYQFNDTIHLGFPTQLLHDVDLRELIVKIDEVINTIQPNIIYLINRSDVHSDHRVAFEAVYSCTKSFRKPFIERILMYETLSETEFSPPFSSSSFIPNVFVDISDFYEKKKEIMMLFDTEVMPSPFPRSLSSIEALARYRGSRIGEDFAEAFMLLYEKC